MQKLFTFILALSLSVGLWAENSVIEYTATEKLESQFNQIGTVVSHEFNDGSGTVTYDSEITKITAQAFNPCPSLTSITLPSSVTVIDTAAFYRCSSLTSVIMPNVTTISYAAFENCTSLASFLLPASVETIGNYAFSGCGLTSLVLPAGVKTVGMGAFDGCNALEVISVEDSNTIYEDRDCNAIIEKATNTLICGCKSTVIPASVAVIGDYAFAYLTGLLSIDLQNVTEIGESAFEGCSELTYISLPASVETIVDYAFYDCYSLKDVYVAWTENIPEINAEVFENIAADEGVSAATLHIPAGTKELYAAADVWKNFGTIEEYIAPSSALPVLGDRQQATGKMFMHKGQVYIRKDGKTYTILGVEE